MCYFEILISKHYISLNSHIIYSVDLNIGSFRTKFSSLTPLSESTLLPQVERNAKVVYLGFYFWESERLIYLFVGYLKMLFGLVGYE